MRKFEFCTLGDEDFKNKFTKIVSDGWRSGNELQYFWDGFASNFWEQNDW